MRAPLNYSTLPDILCDKITSITDVVWAEGDTSLLHLPLAAIIGTRDPTPEGIKRTHMITRQLVEDGWCIVSGLAKGVDTEAHRTALEMGGKTIAVLGTPLDKYYPQENAPLQKEIAEKGLLLSRFAPGSKTTRASFPQRNVLMGAISHLNILIEAGEASGTKYQVEAALRYKRHVGILASLAAKEYPWIKSALGNEHCTVIGTSEELALILSKLKHDANLLVNADDTNVPVVFISHATPEDNLFTRWLAGKLITSGYKVWVDLHQLVGGEEFWMEIEKSIRTKTAKFLFVLTKASASKAGCLNELSLACSIGATKRNFVTPLRLDDIAFNEAPIQIGRLNMVDFQHSWAKGLTQLLESLKKDGVPKLQGSGPSYAKKWWAASLDDCHGLVSEPETLTSNIYPLRNTPDFIFLQRTNRKKEFGGAKITRSPRGVWADQKFKLSLTRFAGDFETYDAETFLNSGYSSAGIDSIRAKQIYFHLLRAEICNYLTKSGFSEYPLSSRQSAFWIPTFGKDHDEYPLKRVDGKDTRRGLTGYTTLKDKDGNVKGVRNWHFAIEIKIIEYPTLAVLTKSHVVFTENSQLYESKRKQHSCRRRFCKNWFNDAWSDRLQVMMQLISGSNEKSTIVPIDGNSSIEISSEPILFTSQITYRQDAATPEFDWDEVDLTEEESDEDEADL